MLNFPKVEILIFLIIICNIHLHSCKSTLSLISKLDLVFHTFLQEKCSVHHLVGKNETPLWNYWVSNTTCHIIDAVGPNNFGRYNHTLLRRSHGQSSHSNVVRKFDGNCEAKFIHLDLAQQKYNVVHDLLYGMVLANENPDYVVFVQDSNVTWTPEVFNLKFGSIFYTLGSKFMFLTGEMNLYFLCNHCYELEQLTSKHVFNFDLVMLRNFDELHVMWYKVHKNLNWGSLHVDPIPFLRRLNGSCSLYKSGLNTPGEDCVFLEMMQRFNFSIRGDGTDTSIGQKIVGGIFHGQISGADFNRAVFLIPSAVKNQWINFACGYKPYVLVTMVGVSNISFLTLLEPLDAYCWIGLVITYFIVALLIFNDFKMDPTLMSDSWKTGIYKNDIHSIRIAGFWGLSVLLEQSSHHLLKRFQWSWITASCWLLLSFILTNGYKSDLFSSMASPRFPTVPNSIQDLVLHYRHLPMITTTKHYVEGKYAFPTLKDIVLPDMAEGLSTQSIHMQLRESMIFINGTDAALIANISMGLAVNSDLGHPVHIIENFALISSESDANRFSVLSERFTKFIPIQNANQVSPYITRVPWFGYRNYFTTIFTRALGSLVETGIYDRWMRHREIFTKVESLQKVKVIMNDQKQRNLDQQKLNNGTNPIPTTSGRKTNFYALANLVAKRERRKSGNAVLIGVSFQNVKIAVILFGLCCAIGVSTFVSEISFNRVQRRLFIKRTTVVKFALAK